MRRLDADISTRFQMLGEQEVQVLVDFLKAGMGAYEDGEAVIDALKSRQRTKARHQ